MADKKLFPISINQNPYPLLSDGLEFEKAVRAQVENILIQFKAVLPSNYVSEVMGPNYLLDFQAIADIIARMQITAQELYEDSDFNFTRSEYLWQILGALVFPNSSKLGFPEIEGDTSYRDFLKQMVLLLLQGSKESPITEGMQLVTNSLVSIIEKVKYIGTPGVLWTNKDQFTFEVNIETNGGTAFPSEDPFVLEKNIKIILQALKPAHTLYEYRHIFREVFETLFEDTYSVDLKDYYYDDFRKFCCGACCLTGTLGHANNGVYFYDETRDFSNISVNSILKITSGLNVGEYRVLEILSLFSLIVNVKRVYETTPTALSGKLLTTDGYFEDSAQNFGLCEENEILEIFEGPNKGKYRLNMLLGTNGGKIGITAGPGTKVRPSKSILRLNKRLIEEENIIYSVSVDRLGVQENNIVTREDVSLYFYL